MQLCTTGFPRSSSSSLLPCLNCKLHYHLWPLMFRSRLPRYSRSKLYPYVPLGHWLSELVSIRMGSLAGLSTKALLSGSPVCMHAEFLTSRLPSTCFLCHTMCSVCSVGFCYDIFVLISFSAIFTVFHFHACYPSLITLVSPASFPFQVSPQFTEHGGLLVPLVHVLYSPRQLSHILLYLNVSFIVPCQGVFIV